MAEAIERIYKLTVDGTQAIRHLQNIEKATTGTNDKLSRMGDAIKGGLAAFAIQETASRLVGFLTDTAKAMDDLGDSSQKLGIAAQSLETFRLAAQFSGSDANTVDTALKKLSKTMADFDEGSKPAVEAFGKLGINPQGKSVAEVLTEISDAFADLPDDANKTAVAMELLGKSGSELIPMLNGGSSALQDFNQQLRDMGLALTEEDIANAQALGDAMDVMRKQTEGAARQFLTGLTPALTEIVKGFTDGSVAAEKWNYWGKQTGLLLKGIVEAAKGTGEAFVNMGKVGVAAFQSLTTFDFNPVKKAWSDFQQFGTDYTKRMAALDDEAKRIEDDRTFERIAKAISLPDYSDEKPKRAAKAIADTGKAAKSAATQLSDYQKTLNTLESEFDTLTGRLEGWGRVETLLAQVRRENLKLTDDEYIALLARAEAIDQLTQRLEEQAEAEKAMQDAISKGEARTEDLQGKAAAWQAALDPMIAYEQKYREIQELEQAGFLTTEQAAQAREATIKQAEKAMDEFNKKGKESQDVWADVGKVLDDAIGQGLADVLLDSSKGIKDWVSSFLNQMARILMNKALMGLFSSLFGTTGGVGSALTGFLGGLFGGGRAAGGDVAPNTIYQVGEKGPEWFVPDGAGTIVPNGESPFGNNVTANTYITVNTDGTTTTTGDDIRLAKKIDNAVKQTIMNEMRPGGILSAVPQK